MQDIVASLRPSTTSFSGPAPVTSQITDSYNLVLTDVKLADEGEYRCVVLNLNPQSKSANLGVWVLPSEVSIDGEMEISKEMPAPGESITISRTCEVDGVVPSATLTWAYKISSVATSIEGELDKDFVSGDVEDVPEGVNYNVEVKKFSGESDGKFKSNSTITVTFTAADNSDGKVEENLQIEVRCKSKQIGLVEEYERESNPIKVSVTEREVIALTTTLPAVKKTRIPGYAEPTDKPGSTTKGKEPMSGANTGGGCTSGCVTGIVVALLLVLIIGVIVVVIFVLRNRKAKNAKQDVSKDKKGNVMVFATCKCMSPFSQGP
ncbi:uncharacterized protein LOC100372979 [Saccoglossus kowalevskii]